MSGGGRGEFGGGELVEILRFARDDMFFCFCSSTALGSVTATPVGRFIPQKKTRDGAEVAFRERQDGRVKRPLQVRLG